VSDTQVVLDAPPDFPENPRATAGYDPFMSALMGDRLRLPVAGDATVDVNITRQKGKIIYSIHIEAKESGVFSSKKSSRNRVKVVAFLDGLYLQDGRGQMREAVDRAVNHIDDLLNEGAFEECDEIFRQADAYEMSSPLIISFLGITLAAKGKLPSRVRFLQDARAKIVADVGPERATQLMSKYG
jgi:hypothetical protein